MSLLRILAFVLIIAGAVALAYGGFSFTRETHSAKLGPFEFAVQEKERVELPRWLAIGAIAVGGLVLLVSGRKS